MAKFKPFGAAVILSALIVTPVFAHGSGVRPQAHGTEGRQVAAPPWSAACMTDHGPSECGEPMWVYGSHAAISGYRNAF
jgi:hypothetical protein